jgi:hypothetical protein
MARTRNSWVPSVRLLYSTGELHSANGSTSSEHSNVEPGSLERKLKLASRSVVLGSGADSMVVVGAVRSPLTVHVQLAGVGSMFPETSTARTSSVCWPSVRSGKAGGSGHAANGAPSSEHWNVAFGSLLSKANLAVVRSDGSVGPHTIVVSGASCVTIVHSCLVTGASADVSPTSTRTSKVCAPRASPS